MTPISQIEKIIMGVIIAIALGVFIYLGYTKAILERDLAQSKLDVEALSVQNKNFSDTIEKTNKAITDMALASKQREDAAVIAIKAAQSAADAFNAQAAAIQNQRPQGATDCASAEAMLNDYLARNK